MERMTYREPSTQIATAAQRGSEVASTNWRQSLPTLSSERARLRELRLSDASSLFAMLTTEEVARFISPPPSTVGAFEEFITTTLKQQAAGTLVCFAVTVPNDDTAIGIFQVRQLEPGFETAEWGFAIGSPFWGTGIFLDGAALVLDFVFDTVGVRRLEARAVVQNGRGNGALLKVGAVQEGVLRKSFLRHGRELDQVLYSILDVDWREWRLGSWPARRPQVH
jgi:RimJ/RimL family protein N-acetyltransferase